MADRYATLKRYAERTRRFTLSGTFTAVIDQQCGGVVVLCLDGSEIHEGSNGRLYKHGIAEFGGKRCYCGEPS